MNVFHNLLLGATALGAFVTISVLMSFVLLGATSFWTVAYLMAVWDQMKSKFLKKMDIFSKK